MKRKLILCPDINPSSFVLLFEKGSSEDSWSVRDYSRPGMVVTRYSNDFEFDLPTLKLRISQSVDAPVLPTNDLRAWHQLTMDTNARFQLLAAEPPPREAVEPCAEIKPAQSGSAYPLLRADLLQALPKARKQHDMKRILTSPNSEDWVTWNAFALLQLITPLTWWHHLVRLAQQANPSLNLPGNWREIPKVELWECVRAPKEYEAASRERMKVSALAKHIARAQSAGPVEGDSEIDICLKSKSITLFIEAKLGSDISMRTTYDPVRNQVARNIDCLLDVSGSTVPMFWMLVRDRQEGRAYTQLMTTYKNDPTKLSEALPHRDLAILKEIAARLSIILWKDLLAVIDPTKVTDVQTYDVHQELIRRVD